MIEVKGLLRFNDDGEIWFQAASVGNRCIHGRQDTQSQTTLDSLVEIAEIHGRNLVAEAKKFPDDGNHTSGEAEPTITNR